MRIPRLPPYPCQSTSERFVGDSEDKGMGVRKSSTKSIAVGGRPLRQGLVNRGKVELLDVPPLVAQLCGLERRTARGGRDSIDHSPGSRVLAPPIGSAPKSDGRRALSELSFPQVLRSALTNRAIA